MRRTTRLFVPVALFAAALFPCASRPLDAQEFLGNRVIVTGSSPDENNLTSPNIESDRARILAEPAATDVAGREDLDRGRGAYIEDLLRYQPGLIIQSSQGGEDDKLSIRGSGVQNDDLSGLGILLDGIPLNQSDGEAYLWDVDLQTIKYAEVYRGGDALRYGGVYLGGAINLVSLTGRDAPPLSVRATFGSFGYYEQGILSGFSHGAWDFLGAVTNHFQDGYRDHSSDNFQKVTLSVGTKLGEHVENRLSFFYGRLEQDNPSGLDKDDLNNDPTSADPEAVEQNWSNRWNYYRVMDRFVYKNNDNQFLLAVSWNHRDVNVRDEYEDDYHLGATQYFSDDYGLDVSWENTSDLLGQKNRFTIGIVGDFEPETDSFYAYDPNNERKLQGLLFADRTYYLNLPLYVEDQHWFTKQFSVRAGFQAAFVNRVFKDLYQSPTLGDQTHRDNFMAINPKLGFAYQWNDQSLVYISGSRSFQPPSFDESLEVVEGVDGGQVFNELHSQGAITLEIGTRGEYGPLQWDVALYRSWVKDELLDLNNAQGVPLGTFNASHTIHQGIEAELELDLAHSLLVHNPPATTARTSGTDGKEHKAQVAAEKWATDRIVLQQAYTLSDFRFDGDDAYGDNRVAGTPVHFYKAELRYEHPAGFFLGVNVEWNIVKYPVDEANSLYADPYALLGVRLGYRTRKGLQVFFEAKNLTNKTYAASVEPLADARTSDDTDSFNPGNGRAFYGGLGWTW